MNPPKISIIMLTFDRPQFIARAVKSVLVQTFSDWELIVVDDGKGDATERTVREMFFGDPRLQYFHRAEKTRIAGASNFGLEKARGEYIAILDDDDYWASETKLFQQAEFLDRNPEYVGCGGGYILVDEKGREQGRYLKPANDADIRKNALAANPMVNSTTLFRKDAAKKVGGYDESLLEFADWDFWLKMGLAGKLYNFPHYFLYYQVWGGGASFTRQKDAARSAFRIFNRYRHEYPGVFMGAISASAYFLHAHLPAWIKRFSSPLFSKLKKILFSGPRN